MSRFATPSIKSSPDILTALSGIAALVMLLGCIWLVFHNMEQSSTSDRSDDGGVFTLID
ncbi:MAG: hypothetical protein MK077_05265 [Phycisphaerales bacterium]|nr:hypothetical protein [Phycisphaerales bacterium]